MVTSLIASNDCILLYVVATVACRGYDDCNNVVDAYGSCNDYNTIAACGGYSNVTMTFVGYV